MHQRRYQLWSVDPLTDDAWPILGTYTLAGAKRILASYNRLDGCHRIVEIRPVDVGIPRDHPFWCQVRFIRSGRVVLRRIIADDAYGAVRKLVRRFGGGIDSVSVWLFENEMQAGDPPLLQIDRDGKVWKAKRIAS